MEHPQAVICSLQCASLSSKVRLLQGAVILPHSEHRWNDGHERMAQHQVAECSLWLSVSPSLPCRGTKRPRATLGVKCRVMGETVMYVNLQTHL